MLKELINELNVEIDNLNKNGEADIKKNYLNILKKLIDLLQQK